MNVVTITIAGETVSELMDELKKALGGAPSAPAEEEAPAKKKKSGKKKKPEPVEEPVDVVEEEESEDDDDFGEDDEPLAVSKQDVINRFKAAVEAGVVKKDVGKALKKAVGTSSLSDIDPGDYVKVIGILNDLEEAL